MGKNREVFESLFGQGKINMRRSSLFDIPPEPMLNGFDFGKVEGMMLGLAIGDALGNTSEGMTPAEMDSLIGSATRPMPPCGQLR